MTVNKPPSPPYYVVIFTSARKEDANEYAETAARMKSRAANMPGYLGFESARQENGTTISISYWESKDAIRNWKEDSEHAQARMRGRTEWYTDYKVEVAKVERAYTKPNK